MIESAPWEQLPDEIVVRILAEMEIEDLLIMKGVSKQLNTLFWQSSLHNHLDLGRLSTSFQQASSFSNCPGPPFILNHPHASTSRPDTSFLRLLSDRGFSFPTDEVSNYAFECPAPSIPITPPSRYSSFVPERRVASSTASTVGSPSLNGMDHSLILPATLRRLIPLAKHLTITSYPHSLCPILPLLSTSHLRSLDLSYTPLSILPADLLDSTLTRLGEELKVLKLRGWRGILDVKQIAEICPALVELDLSWTRIQGLPFLAEEGKQGLEGLMGDDDEEEDEDLEVHSGFAPQVWTFPANQLFAKVTRLSLSYCLNLSNRTLSRFLRDLPSSVRHLELAGLEQLSMTTLMNLRVTRSILSGGENDEDCSTGLVSDLRSVDLTGIDWITRRDVALIQAHWSETRLETIPRLNRSGAMEMDTNHQLVNEVSSMVLPTPIPLVSATLQNGLYTPPVSPEPPRSILKTQMARSVDLNSAWNKKARTVLSVDTHGPDWKERDEWQIEILSSAVLDSDDEEGYRRYIRQIAQSSGGMYEESFLL